jgi:antitoxin CcdA
MITGYDVDAPKRPVNMSLNEDLVRKAREITDNLSEQVEKLLADYVLVEQKRRADEEARLDAAVSAWNEFNDRFGSFADEHSTL